MEFTNSKLSNFILFSNKNVEKLARTLINESANAVLLEMYEDKMLLADHKSNDLYLADYKFDGKTLVVENFDHIDIVKDNSELKEAVSSYFDSDGYDTAMLSEAYSNDIEAENTDLKDSLVAALASKKNEGADYTQAIGINEEISEVKEMPFFKKYTELLAESPSSSIKVIDWVNPVKVSIINEDENKVIVSNAKDKAKALTKDKEFKKVFAEAVKEMVDGDSYSMTELLEDNSALVSLSKTDLKEFVGMSIIGDKELMNNRKAICEQIENLISEDEELMEARTLFEEEGSEETESDAELATSDKDIDALKSALDKAAEKITDEKLLTKINALKDALESSKDTGTTEVGTVKECVELLNM